MCSSDLFLGLIAILFPPIAGMLIPFCSSRDGFGTHANILLVWVKRGICSADSIINICLCVLGFIPGLLHAWYIIAKYPEIDYEQIPSQDAEQGHVAYIIVQSPNGSQRRVVKSNVRPSGPPSGGYGTTAPMAPPVHQSENGAWNNNAAEGSSGGAVPPTYAEAVQGDNKVQTQD